MKASTGLTVINLENQVNKIAQELKINPQAWRKFWLCLKDLKKHNLKMYAHSLRVGIYSYGLAGSEGTHDLKFSLFGGCGHDLGKCEIPNDLLNSTSLTEDQFNHVKDHSHHGFHKLKDDFLYTAFVAGLHHKYKIDGDGYGIDLDKVSPIPLSKEDKRRIEEMVRLVATADFYDSLVTRRNEKRLLKDPRNPQEKITVMKRHFPDSANRIAWLVKNTIL